MSLLDEDAAFMPNLKSTKSQKSRSSTVKRKKPKDFTDEDE
jgi:hypothetical protein